MGGSGPRRGLSAAGTTEGSGHALNTPLVEGLATVKAELVDSCRRCHLTAMQRQQLAQGRALRKNCPRCEPWTVPVEWHASCDGSPRYAYKNANNSAAMAQAFGCMVGGEEQHGTWRLVIHDDARQGAVQVVAMTEAGIARAWADALERGCETVVAPHVATGCWPAPFCGCRAAATYTKEMAVKRLVNAHMKYMLRRRGRGARRSATRGGQNGASLQ